jgi:hypothetical protein
MKRREFITLLGGAAAAWPFAAKAQQPAKVARVGYLGLGPASATSSRVEALRAGLRDLGWVEGKNIVIEFRWADGVQQLPELAVGHFVTLRRCRSKSTERLPFSTDAVAACPWRGAFEGRLAYGTESALQEASCRSRSHWCRAISFAPEGTLTPIR